MKTRRQAKKFPDAAERRRTAIKKGLLQKQQPEIIRNGNIWLESEPGRTKEGKREDIEQQGYKNTGIDCCFRLCAAGGASVSPPAHGANDNHKTTYPSFKRGGIGGARSLPPPVADFTSSVRLTPATFPRGEGSGSVLRVGISKQSRPAQESSAPEADRRPRQRARHTRLL